MPSIPPVSTNEQRLLAAIVFTDVAGFSSRVETAEAVTLAFLERDFITMRLFSTTHSGKVIKTTGDGLLLYFTSAVDAVEWALKTQRHLADQASRLPTKEILQHRIGIHLGEVLVGGGDVMGDGVNVAARVQTEARAGGICISQAVYGVVKNKVRMDVVRLEPRRLKNIAELVQMYHVLLDPPARKALETAPAAAPAPAPAPKSAFTPRNVAVATLLIAGLGGAATLLYRAQQENQNELAGSRQLRDELGAALRSEATEPAAKPAAESPGEATPVAPAPAPAAVAETTDEVDFLKLTVNQPARADGTEAREIALRQAHESLATLEAWRTTALQHYTRESPLIVRPLRAPSRQTLAVFINADQQVSFVEGGAIRNRPWSNLGAEVQGAIIASLLSSSTVPIPRAIARGAEAFAFLNGLPDMAALLAR